MAQPLIVVYDVRVNVLCSAIVNMTINPSSGCLKMFQLTFVNATIIGLVTGEVLFWYSLQSGLCVD